MSRDIRQICAPTSWPDPPQPMSFSALKNIEACPLSWTLSSAEYSDLWAGNGYPAKVGISAILGQTIHTAVEIVLRAARSPDDRSFASRMMSVVRASGGLSALIDQGLSAVLDDYADNPRMEALVNGFRRGTLTLPPTARTSLQSLLKKIADEPTTVPDRRDSGATTGSNEARALSFGIFTEIGLSAMGHDWYGKIDVLRNGPDSVEIEDIKTGAPKEADHEQLYVYSWLWWRDSARNPSARLPTRLSIRYIDSSVDLAVLDESDLTQFEASLLDRTTKAIADVTGGAGEARPEAAICRFCDVRQFCDTYWADSNLLEATAMNGFGDAEARLTGILSPRTWRIETLTGFGLETGTPAFLRGVLPSDLAQTGSIVRILGAKMIEPSVDEPDEQQPEIRLGSQSELFTLPPDTRSG